MRFQMIGVQFDQARHEQIAARIFAAGGCVALANFSDAASGDRNLAPVDHAIREHDPGVADDGL